MASLLAQMYEKKQNISLTHFNYPDERKKFVARLMTHLPVLYPLVISLQLFLILSYGMSRLLILFLEHRFNPLQLLFVGVARKLQVFVDVFCKNAELVLMYVHKVKLKLVLL